MSNWKKYHQQDNGKDFLQIRVTGAIHGFLNLCIDCNFFVDSICAITKQSQSTKMNRTFPTTSARRQMHKKERNYFLDVQQEASGITRQNATCSSVGLCSNVNPQSLLQNKSISFTPCITWKISLETVASRLGYFWGQLKVSSDDLLMITTSLLHHQWTLKGGGGGGGYKYEN